jgi:phage head maturation protease
MTVGPRGWTAASICHRFSDSDPAPSSYDAKNHSADCIISMGSPVTRFYGVEKLKIDSASIDTSRVSSGICPFLDSHNAVGISNLLGRVTATWVKSGALWGRIVFNQTREGKNAESMISRGELRGVSCGYSVQSWSVQDKNGRVVDADSVGWNDEEYVYTATDWTIFEVSACTIPADQNAGFRSIGSVEDRTLAQHPDHFADVHARMWARQRMSERQSANFGDLND